MSDIYKETLCTRCAHFQVCNKTEEFLRIVKTLDEVTICTVDHSYIDLKSIPWVHLGELCCDYYLTNKATRHVE